MWIRDGRSSAHVSEVGGTVQCWNVDGVNLFFPECFMPSGNEMKLRGGMPICAPIFGSVPCGRVPHSAGIGKYPKHGFVRKSNLTMDLPEYGLSAVILQRTLEPLIGFAWRHFVVLGAVVCGNELRHNLRITNENDLGVPMPIRPGLHPYFVVPHNSAQVTWGTDAHRNFMLDECNPTNQIHFVGKISGGKASVRIAGVGKVEMQLVGYTHIVVWSDSPKYLCVEPVLGLPDKLEYDLCSGEGAELSAVFSFHKTD